MGRYYNGDIEGKFWFGVQDSNDADFFGYVGEQPQELNYYFDESHIKQVKDGIKKCKKELGTFKKGFDEFFKSCNGYNDKILEDYFKTDATTIRTKLEWYARLELGEKILKRLEKNGECNFTAEC